MGVGGPTIVVVIFQFCIVIKDRYFPTTLYFRGHMDHRIVTVLVLPFLQNIIPKMTTINATATTTTNLGSWLHAIVLGLWNSFRIYGTVPWLFVVHLLYSVRCAYASARSVRDGNDDHHRQDKRVH